MTFQCPYCQGCGYHICEDCCGSGELAECDFCGRVHPSYEIDENGRCPTCAEEEGLKEDETTLKNEKGA